MAFEFNKKLPPLPGEYKAPLSEAEEEDTLPFGIYPSDNPGTPYVPNNPANSWWEELPYLGSSNEDATIVSLGNQQPAVGYGSNVWMTNIAEDEAGLTSTSAKQQITEIYEFNPDDNPILYKNLEYQVNSDNFNAIYDSHYSPQDGSSWEKQIQDRMKNQRSSRYKKYNTYTGADIVPVVSFPNGASHTIGEISTISISTHSETFPVRMLGKRSVQGFTRGPRTIAGSIIFTQFDLYPFYDIVSSSFSKQEVWNTDHGQVFPLADSLPPFDITISFMNEYGNYGYQEKSMSTRKSQPQGSVLRLYGVVIVDDGITLSIDDLVPETVYSYMAAGIAPMHYPSGWEIQND